MAASAAISDRSLNTSSPDLSSDAPQISSPPSSPPGFPWEQKLSNNDASPTRRKLPVSLKPPPKTAFSLLGKRKPLETLTENARPSKKANRKPAKTDNKQTLTQLQISLGQRVQTKCTVCGMEYVASSAEDRKLHDTYHRQQTEGYDVGKDFVRKARDAKSVFKAQQGKDEDVICAVDCFDTSARRKRAQAVLEMAQRDLGAVAIDEKELWSRYMETTHESSTKESGKKKTQDRPSRYTAYMYIRDTKCVGFLLAERITQAYPVTGPTVENKLPVASARMEENPEGGALAALRARRKAEAEAKQLAEAEEKKADDRPLELSETGQSASLGIARIWTSPTHRRQNIASSLLDAACEHRELGLTMVEKEDRIGQVAFSQPTALGTKLARRWSGRRLGWLVYID